VRGWREALCLSNDESDLMGTLLHLLPDALAWRSLRVAKRRRLLAAPAWGQLWRLVRAMGHEPAVGEWLNDVQGDVERLAAAGPIEPPLVTGDDLIAMGRKPGPAFARLLEEVYDEQLEGRVATREQGLGWLRERSDGAT
jgi:poly(A) polymerase